MTPAARIQAAIEALDGIIDGRPVEQVLTGWARRSRFAGSKDRAAVRDHVFDALRCRRSLAALGGASTGRGLMLGALRRDGIDPDEVFGAGGHAPVGLTPDEVSAGRCPAPGAEALDIPDWLWPEFEKSLGKDAEAAAAALRHRAEAHLRVNIARTTLNQAIAALAKDGITAMSHAASPTALTVRDGSRRIRNCAAYLDGRVELQDAASQAVVDLLELRPGMRVLDYCAGGGGKALAAAATGADVFAHDASLARMKDIPARAARAGVAIRCLKTGQLSSHAPFDVVLCDAPCSGSGAWRRSPEGKWRLTAEGLDALSSTQAGILRTARSLVKDTGVLAYATCSILQCENAAIIKEFELDFPGWRRSAIKSWSVLDGTDGFFSAHLTRVSQGR